MNDPAGMGRLSGYYVTCHGCGRQIPDTEWSCADEWFCECGEEGQVSYDDEEE